MKEKTANIKGLSDLSRLLIQVLPVSFFIGEIRPLV